MGEIFRYHEDSRTAERWSMASKYRRLEEAARHHALEMAVADVDTAPCEYVAPDQDSA